MVPAITRLYFLALASTLVSAAVKIVTTDKTGSVLKLDANDDNYYFSPSKPIMSIPISQSCRLPGGYVPATSITTQFTPISKQVLQSHMESFSSIDDVWEMGFTKSLFVNYTGSATAFFDDDAKSWLEANQVSHLFLSESIRAPALKKTIVEKITETPQYSGPYFISYPSSEKLAIHPAYRLHEDKYDAFIFGIIPNSNGGWLSTNITLPSGSDKSKMAQYIPIPSRLSILSAMMPLNGVRFGLKDLFDVEDIPTAAGSRAYLMTHPIPVQTAPSIQRLIIAGASLVGKTRTAQFAHGAQPWEFNDYSYSWNPRGDGYLTASSSSSGSACAIAGYDWLDFTVGSDTRGSVRKPAAFVGSYGLRPTFGSIDLTGVVPLSEEMDTAGFFARDPKLFAEVQRIWFSESPVTIKRQAIKFPAKVLYPIDHFPVKNPAAQRLYDNFVQSLQDVLNMKKFPVNITRELTPYFPKGNFRELQQISSRLAEYRSWTSVGKPVSDNFFIQYGEMPVFDPVPERMFARARSFSDMDFIDAVEMKHAFRDSLNEGFFKSDVKSCSQTLLMYDIANGGLPLYRTKELNEGSTHRGEPSGADDENPKLSEFMNLLASIAELPEVTIPIGQVEYHSPVSKQTELLPVAVQLVARKGCDGMLMDLVNTLTDKGVIKAVKTGKSAF